MLLFFCSSFDEKVKLVFQMYDFDNDGLINDNDVITIISCMPINKSANLRVEGKFTKEGGGAQNF
jgi:Ca2+-binding EF-hand superfamily protein